MYKLGTIIPLLLIIGCVGPYYGFTENEWASMSPEERIIAKKEYERAINAKNKLSSSNRIEEATKTLERRGVENEG